jgi:diguanylate cyclase (GGDEF)-like protein
MVEAATSHPNAMLLGHAQADGPEHLPAAELDDVDEALVLPKSDAHMAACIEQTLQGGFAALTFPSDLESRYEAVTSGQRIRELKASGVAIAFLMNLFLLSDRAMVPDMFQLAMSCRLGLYMPAMLGGIFLIDRFKSVIWREVFVAQAGVLACVIQLLMCVGSQSPHAMAYLVGITMVIFFNNVYSRIRFWVALPVNAVYLGMFALGASLFPSVDWALLVPIALMLASTSAFTLYYLYSLEHEERHNFLLGQRQKALADALGHANAKLTRVSRTDALTQVANRRHFDEHLAQVWQRARKDTHDVTVLMMDIDHFKPFNDRYGHPAGDACLQKVASVIRQGLRRPGDLVARYGGEEFIAVLHKATPEQVQMAAERVRAAVAALNIKHEGSPLHGCVTISVGWASACPGAESAGVSGLIARADEALYQAKNRGRNCLWPQIPKPAEAHTA